MPAQTAPLAVLPGFRRRISITPGPGRVVAALEDDYHCMAVTLHHDGTTITALDAEMDRVPWTTCPGARAVIAQTFIGATLAAAAALGQKQANCTHLYDLAVLAAAHTNDVAPTRYDILACDPVDGIAIAEIRRDDALVLRLEHRGNVISAPSAIAGLSLFKLRGWIDGLHGGEAEAARLLQWGTILAHGRITPMERQSYASKMPSNCYTFQPGTKEVARRVGRVLDFSGSSLDPLEHFGPAGFGARG